MKKKYQIFTPGDYVIKLLECAEFKEDLYGKLILENSCGDGNILKTVVQLYIDDCKNNKFDDLQISEGLSRDIIGYEIDPIYWQKCIDNLNAIVAFNGLPYVDWKIYNEDF